MTATLIGLAAVFLLLFLGMPIGVGMGIVGVAGFAWLISTDAAFAMLGQTSASAVMNYHFSVVPLFLLMGNFVVQSRLAEELYEAANAFLGRLKGGLALSTIVACGGFGAVCGSSVATAATMTKVAVPSMSRYGYAPELSAASVAAGGTLGILIPPSVPMVIYGLITENDIGKLFAAGILPGVIGIVGYMAAVYTYTLWRPDAGPRGPRTDWPARFRALSKIWGVALLFSLVIGGIYLGIFTPTEAAGIGACGSFVIALLRKRLTVRIVRDVLVETVKTTSLLFVILIGALLFTNFVTVAGLPTEFSKLFEGMNIHPLLVILAMVGVYIVMGCIMDSLAMMLLTVPVFYPVVLTLGLDPIWFGVMVVIAIELSLITPPIGLNVFVVKSMVQNSSMSQLFLGLLPFVITDLLRLALLAFVPSIALFLPQLMD